MRNKIAKVFMAMGIICIGFAMGLLLYNNFENKKAQDNADVLLESVRISITEQGEKKEPADPFDKEMKIKEIDGYGYIGYLSIPALELDLPVMSDWDYDSLKISPCRYYGSTGTDNLVIAAHNYDSHFGSLDNLKAGDTVMFTDMESKTYYYTVTSVEELMPTDVDKVKDTGDDLILYTCTYSRAKRITVRCSYSDRVKINDEKIKYNLQ
ncbi:MAG: sortase [Clostridia bacterium]|nr:sortase [Clostridia bacterium]